MLVCCKAGVQGACREPAVQLGSPSERHARARLRGSRTEATLAVHPPPAQMTNKNNTIVERQSVLTMLPFTKTDAPLTELLPRVAELFA